MRGHDGARYGFAAISARGARIELMCEAHPPGCGHSPAQLDSPRSGKKIPIHALSPTRLGSLAADIEQLIERPRRAAKLHQTNRADCYGSNEDHADCACCEQRYSAVKHEGAYGVAAYGLTPNGLGA
jgi:hypothetical protein